MLKNVINYLIGTLANLGLGKIRMFSVLYRRTHQLIFRDKKDEVQCEGFTFFTPKGRAGFNIRVGGSFEPMMTRIFKGLARSGMRIIDVGAHVGYYSFLASRIVGPEGKVYAFEPEHENYRCLECGIAENKLTNVTPVNYAVSNINGFADLHINFGSSVTHSLSERNITKKGVRENVGITTLDDYADKNGIRKVDIIKIDTQGFDAKVINGAKNILVENKNIKIFMEFWPDGMKNAGDEPRLFWNFMTGMSFIPYHIGKEDHSPSSITFEYALERCKTDRSNARDTIVLWSRDALNMQEFD